MPYTLSKRHAFKLQRVCGRTLTDAVCFVAIATAVLSSVTFTAAVFALAIVLGQGLHCGNDPILAMNLVLVLICVPMSLYQFIASLVLLYQAVKLKGNAFLTSLWLTSHIVICVIYGVLIIGKTCISFYHEYYLIGVVTLVAGVVYEVSIIYFCVIVHSFLESPDLIQVCYF